LKPCDLCTLHGISFYMKSEVEVSYEGVTKTCSQVYHSLYTRREESSGHCIDAQGTLFKQCCVRTGAILSSSPATMATTTTTTNLYVIQFRRLRNVVYWSINDFCF
jgi:hypothetical protein